MGIVSEANERINEAYNRGYDLGRAKGREEAIDILMRLDKQLANVLIVALKEKK